MSQTTEERSKLGNNVDTILCDIEGTTTSISFVKDVLFPYVRENLRAYLNEHFEEKECQEDINLLIEHSKTEEPLISGQTKEALIESTIANVLSQMDKDRKTRSLKQLQGHMWKLAYEKGLVKGHIYDDVVPAFERWISRGLKIYIYSSGSVEAQRLLYGYSEKGDLSKYISGNFDTNIGMKVEKSSYENILASLKKSSDNVAFFTDLIREAEAAESAGVQVFLVRRADNPDKETKHFKSIQTFNDVN